MKIFRDCFGHDVRLTDEHLAHIVGHVELIGMESEIERVLRSPTEVRVSVSMVLLFMDHQIVVIVGSPFEHNYSIPLKNPLFTKIRDEENH